MNLEKEIMYAFVVINTCYNFNVVTTEYKEVRDKAYFIRLKNIHSQLLGIKNIIKIINRTKGYKFTIKFNANEEEFLQKNGLNS